MGHLLPQHVQDFTNKEVGKSYLMYQCGTEPPAYEEGKHDLTFSVPLQDGLVVSSTPMIPHIEQLGLMYVIFSYPFTFKTCLYSNECIFYATNSTHALSFLFKFFVMSIDAKSRLSLILQNTLAHHV